MHGSEHAARKDLMILKVVPLIWNINAALSRSIVHQRIDQSDKLKGFVQTAAVNLAILAVLPDI
jgi:hypothetical protein